MLKTAESVSPMHPDKICDRISDAILDECLKQDPDSRCAIETMGGHNIITITGEMTTKAFVDIREVVKRIVGDKYGVQVNIVKQSTDIARGVDTGGAGDQGIMIGYACDENEEMIPQEMYLARSLCKYIYNQHKEDGKTQITINDETGEIETIVASFCNIPKQILQDIVVEWLDIELEIKVIMNVNIYINPAGDWTIGGFEADTGLTGRKLIVDNYGTRIPIGGGAFSGKDATKVDRSGAYMARYIAVDLLNYFDAKNVLVELAYSIGVAEPVMANAKVCLKNNENIEINLLDRSGLSDKTLAEHSAWNLAPNGIIEQLKLKEPIFEKTAEWGAFGDDQFLWNK